MIDTLDVKGFLPVGTETLVLLQKFLKVLEFFNQIKETYASLFLTM